jgi:hypothetical protein
MPDIEATINYSIIKSEDWSGKSVHQHQKLFDPPCESWSDCIDIPCANRVSVNLKLISAVFTCFDDYCLANSLSSSRCIEMRERRDISFCDRVRLNLYIGRRQSCSAECQIIETHPSPGKNPSFEEELVHFRAQMCLSDRTSVFQFKRLHGSFVIPSISSPSLWGFRRNESRAL